MSALFADRVKETTNSTNSPFQMNGASTGFRTFVQGIGNGKKVIATISDGSTKWEIMVATVASGSPDTLTRVATLASSNGGAAETFSSGVKTVWCDLATDYVFRKLLSKSANYTVDAADLGKTIRFTSSATVSLPAAATAADGFFLTIRNDSTGTVTIDPNSTETINGSSTVDIPPGEAWTIGCDGANWFTIAIAASALLPRGMQVFTASGTFTVPAGVNRIRARGWGGGGGGGGSNTTLYGGGGGGGGGYCEKLISGLTPGSTITVTIGGGGSSATGGAGSNGGNTTFGAHFTAGGGFGGGVGTTTAPGAGGNGGTAANGDLNLSGGKGGPAISYTAVNTGLPGGMGGGTFGGFGGTPAQAGGVGGGGGGQNAGTAAGGQGGAGGMVIVEW